MRCRVPILVSCLCTVEAVLGGCAPRTGEAHARLAPSPAPGRAPGTEGEVVQARDGLEVRWWIADDSGGEVGAALFELADGAAPLSPERARDWIDNGLRFVRIPEPRLAELQRRLPAVQSLERTWYGWITQWTPVFTGRRVSPGATILIGGSAAPDGFFRTPGVLRLIARAWPASTREGRVLRLELASQLQTTTRDEALGALGLKGIGARDAAEEGRIFPVLTADTSLVGGWVYVIAPERPGVEWKRAGRVRGDSQGAEGSRELGPQAVPPPTLGEAMMAIDPPTDRPGERALKAVVVLIPR